MTDIFPWLDPGQIGLKVALLSSRDNFLVATHLKLRKWAFKRLYIFYDSKWNCASATLGPGRPFTNVPLRLLPAPPGNFVGFTYIRISFVDASVLTLLQRFKKLFENGITLFLFGIDRRTRNFIHKVLSLIGITNIVKMHTLSSSRQFLTLLERTSPTFLIDCPNLRSFYWDGFDDSRGDPFGKLKHWLHSPCGDGRPKVLYRSFPCLALVLEEYQQEFLSALSSVNVIICFITFFAVEPEEIEQFQLDNRRTNERLAIERTEQGGQCKVCMTRALIGRDERQWAEWVAEAWRGEETRNLIEICTSDQEWGTTD